MDVKNIKARYFTIESSSVDKNGGRYKSDTPISAAKNIANMLFEKHLRMKKISFCIRETTKNSKKNVYNYKADKHKLNNNKKTPTYKINVVAYKTKVIGGKKLAELKPLPEDKNPMRIYNKSQSTTKRTRRNKIL
jgi:hypothetical protein